MIVYCYRVELVTRHISEVLIIICIDKNIFFSFWQDMVFYFYNRMDNSQLKLVAPIHGVVSNLIYNSYGRPICI